MKKEDWERDHLKDEMYIREAEWLEQEHFYEEEKKQKSAKIKFEMIEDKVRKRTSDYVCVDCGVPFLTKRQRKKAIITAFHKGECGLCNEEKAITHIRAYNYLRKTKKVIR